MKLSVLIISILLAQTSWSADWKKLEGIYAVTAEGYIDPMESEPKDSHYRIQLKGSSAKDLYQSMKVETVKDECTGGMAKNINNMQCLYFKAGKSYECHFSINVARQKIDYGVAC